MHILCFEFYALVRCPAKADRAVPACKLIAGVLSEWMCAYSLCRIIRVREWAGISGWCKHQVAAGVGHPATSEVYTQFVLTEPHLIVHHPAFKILCWAFCGI